MDVDNPLVIYCEDDGEYKNMDTYNYMRIYT